MAGVQKKIVRPECILGNSQCRKVEITGEESKHRIPQQFQIRNAWVKAVRVCLGKSTWLPSESDYLCSLHFKPEERFKFGNSWRLNSTAVPSLLLSPPSTTLNIQTPTTSVNSSDSSSGFSSLSSSSSSLVTTPAIRKIRLPRAPKSTPKKKSSNIPSTILFPHSPSLHIICDDKILKLKHKVKKLNSELKISKLRCTRKSKRIKSLKNENVKLKEQQKQYESDQKVINNLNCEMKLLFDTEKQRQNISHPSQIRYCENMKKLALSLQTQSPKLYEKLRSFLPLPHKSSICAWMETIPCEPGINEYFLKQLYNRLLTFHNNYVDIALMIDEMCIKQFLQYIKNKQKFVGLVDHGKFTPEGDLGPASKVLVLMCSGITGGWKQVAGYIFVDKLNSDDQIVFLREGVKVLKSLGFRIHSITSDGNYVNVATFKKLGVDVHKIPETPDMSTVLTDPDFEGISVIFDPPHLLKCIRNGLDDTGIFYTAESPQPNSPTNVEQKYFRCADRIQRSENIRFANDLTKELIEYKNNLMKSRFAYKQFSNSVAVLLETLHDDSHFHNQFRNVEGTVKFTRLIDKTFDLFNSQHKDGMGFKAPWTKNNYKVREEFLIEVRDFLLTLKIEDKETKTIEYEKDGKKFYKKVKYVYDPPRYIPIYKTQRFGIILGLICTINSILHITKNLLNRQDFEPFIYVLTYRMCQDLLEIFFGKLRGACGFDRNPTAFRIQHLMKRNFYGAAMLQRRTGNAQILVGEKKFENMVLPLERKRKSATANSTNSNKNPEKMQVKIDLSKLPPRTDFYYISLSYMIGSSIFKNKNTFTCDCFSFLMCNDEDSPSPSIIKAIERKNYTEKSSLVIPSKSIIEIITYVDALFYQETFNCQFAPRGEGLQNKIISEVLAYIRPLNLFPGFNCTDEHKEELINKVCQMFLRIRYFDFSNRVCHDHRSRRKTWSKLADFQESRGMKKGQKKINIPPSLSPSTTPESTKELGRRISLSLKKKAIKKLKQQPDPQQQILNVNSEPQKPSNITASNLPSTIQPQTPEVFPHFSLIVTTPEKKQPLFQIGASTSTSTRKRPNILRKR